MLKICHYNNIVFIDYIFLLVKSRKAKTPLHIFKLEGFFFFFNFESKLIVSSLLDFLPHTWTCVELIKHLTHLFREISMYLEFNKDELWVMHSSLLNI